MHPIGTLSGLFRAFVVTVVCAACGCGGTPTAPQISAPAYTVTGTVTEATSEGLVPVQGALVTHQASARSVTTDGNGVYTLLRVPAGAVTLVVTRSSFDSATGLITVTGDTRLDFQLVRSRQLPSGRSLAGLVFERVGSVAVPIAGAVIEDSYTHLSALTGPDGRYRIEFNLADLGRFDGFADIFVRRDGFETANRSVVITGDIRLDLELIRR